MRFLLAFLTVASAYAQVTSGGVSGAVFDPSNRPIAGAQIQVSLPRQAFSRIAVSDESGYYRIRDLAPATYELTCVALHFDTVHSVAKVPVNTMVRVEFRLPVAGLAQQLTVSAVVSPVQTESGAAGLVLDRSRIAGLPLNRRDFLQLAFLSAGVATPVEDSELSTRGGFAIHVNGGREESNSYLLDGVDNNDHDVNRYVLQPSVDSVQEFKIAVNSYGAEYGRSAGGQVNVVTRGGGADWHGFAYEYLRNRILDARNFFDGSQKPKYIRNQFGAGAGGPLIRERTYVFANFDGLRERQSWSRLASVPTAAQRTGDLSELNRPILDPFTQQPFPGARIPTSRISTVARKVLEMYPAANLPGLAGNLLAQPVARDAQTLFSGRLDHRLQNAGSLALRYTIGDKDLFEPFTEDPTGIPGFGDFLRDRGHNAMLNWTHAGSGFANSLLLGFNRGTRNLLNENYSTDVSSLWGVSYLPTSAVDFGYPSINVGGLSRVGDVTQLPIVRIANTFQVSDGISRIGGLHGWRAGVELRRVQHDGNLRVLSRGSMSFFGAMTGAGIGDLLLGYPSLTLQSHADNPQSLRTGAFDAYFQDDWKVRPGLTINLGLRYEYNTPPFDPADRMSAFNPSTGKVAQVGTDGISRSGLRPDRNNFAPRVGFAWMPFRRTVVRGGYGMYFDAGMFIVNSSLYFNPPYFTMRVFTPSATNLLTLQNPSPTGGGFAPPASLNTLSPDMVTPYLQSWNLAVQRDLGRNGALTASYAGSAGTHLIRSRDMNQPSPAAGEVAFRRPYPQYGNMLLIEGSAVSDYHSLQLVYDRPLSGGFTILGVYTLSKSIDDTSAFLGTKADKNFPQDSRNFHAERGLSSFDVHQRAAVAWVYRVPSKSQWLRNFGASAVVTAQTGQPFTPILQQDNSNTGNTGGNFGNDRPNLLGPAALDAPSPERWFNTSAFATPPRYTFGTAGRNIVRGPGYFTIDCSLSREFRLMEKSSITAAAQAFNLLNRSNFSLPERIADDPANFGRIYSAKAPRQIQFELRLSF